MPLFALLLFIVGAGSVLFPTSDGLRIGQRDAPSYLSSAESLLAGDGYRTPYGDPGKPVDFEDPTSPVVDFPPGFPALLGAGQAVTDAGVDEVARWVGALAVGAIGLVVFVLGINRGAGPLLSGLAASLAVALAVPYGFQALSEPLYGLLLVIGLGLLARAPSHRLAGSLVAAGLVAAAATSVRTVGLALVATVTVMVFLRIKEPLLRWVTLVAVLLVGVAPFFLLTSGGTRDLAWHPPDLSQVKASVHRLGSWFMAWVSDPTWRFALTALLLSGVGIWLLMMAVRNPARSRVRWRESAAVPGLLSALFHSGAIVATWLLFDAQTSPDLRLMFPVALSMILALLGRSGSSSDRSRARGANAGWLVLLAFAFASALTIAVELGAEMISGELDFNSTAFREGDAVGYLVEEVPEGAVFSNVPDGLWVAGIDLARPLPVEIDPLSRLPNPELDTEMAQLDESVSEEGSVIHYRLDHYREYLVGLDSVRSIAPCVLAQDVESLVLASRSNPLCEQ